MKPKTRKPAKLKRIEITSTIFSIDIVMKEHRIPAYLRKCKKQFFADKPEKLSNSSWKRQRQLKEWRESVGSREMSVVISSINQL